jgi:nicotinamide phosphoribosyltransferase
MARRFRQYLNDECRSIGESPMKAGRMCTDFSMRGMTSPESAESSGGAHMLFFDSSANIPAMCWIQNYYCVSFGNFQGAGVPSTEHSVMSSYGIYEEEAYKTLLKRFPTGPLSIVLDTYDLWNVVNNILPSLKDKILSRNGTIYIHLDSGNPVDIIVGDPESSDCNEHKGIVELLWNHFGGTVGDNGLKLLDNHIRVTYGNAITLDRCKAICQGLRAKGFSPLNVSFGIDSYTYQCVTRDTYSFEFCCTNAVIDGQSRAIYKSPKTDKDSFKASHKGLCRVYYKDGKLRVQDGLGPSDFDYMNWNELKSVFVDGNFMLMEHFKTIKERCFEGLDW